SASFSFLRTPSVSNSIEEQITEPAAKREMTVYSLDPLEDPRWAEFVQRHPRASVFHTPGWLEALRRTYGYAPVLYTTSLPRAEREGLTYEGGRSESLLQQLYGLLRITRRRHHLPPQPLDWFRNLVDCLGEDACIRIASKGGQPVAGILTLSHGKRMVYKYGG